MNLAELSELKCHIGFLPIAVDGVSLGEIEIVPGKLTNEAWLSLRADLQRTWTGLVYHDASATTLAATGPDPADLWRRLSPVILDLSDNPVTVLSQQEKLVRHERVRRASELTASVVIASARGRPGRSRGLAACVSEPERAFVRDCMLRLAAYALSHPHGESTSRAVDLTLARTIFAAPSRVSVGVSHLVRHEPRLRQVAQVRQALLNVEASIVEGPGDLRIGVHGMDRLYEYWVFLAVLRQLQEEFGEPVGEGFEALARRLSGRRVRLEIPPGATIEFPGGIIAAFNPTITQSGRQSWLGLELAAHHASTGMPSPLVATPDVVVARPVGDRYELAVLDAKYRVRHRIDPSLWDVYAKYSRIRSRSRGAVRVVAIAHPHHDLDIRWPGQFALPFVPGLGSSLEWIPPDWLDAVALRPAEHGAADTSAPQNPIGRPPLPPAPPSPPAPPAAPVGPAATDSADPTPEFLARHALSADMGRSALGLVRHLATLERPSWMDSLRWIVERFERWELDAAAGSSRLLFSTIGQLHAVACREVTNLSTISAPLSGLIHEALRAGPPLNVRVVDGADGVQMLLRSLLAGSPAVPSTTNQRSSASLAATPPPRPPSSSGEAVAHGAPIVVLDQDWTRAVLNGRRIDLARAKRRLAPAGESCFVIGYGQGIVAAFHQAARQYGWHTLQADRRPTALEALAGLMEELRPSAVTLLSGFDDMADVARAWGAAVLPVTSLDDLVIR